MSVFGMFLEPAIFRDIMVPPREKPVFLGPASSILIFLFYGSPVLHFDLQMQKSSFFAPFFSLKIGDFDWEL